MEVEERIGWGCDAPNEKARWALLCHFCLGNGTLAGEVCTACQGQKMIEQHRCQNSTIVRENIENFRAYRLFKEQAVLPVLGGMYQQTAHFLNTLELCDLVIARLTKINSDNISAVKKLGQRSGRSKHNLHTKT